MALDNKYIVLADTNINENVEKLAKLGLITNHAYQVIDIASVKNPNGDDIQLLKIKNLLGVDWGLSPIPIKIYSTFYLFFIKK
jgi:hypothetical protein